jgi:hypothetical protein
MAFKKTNERIRVTMGGWDGTGYDGEAKERPVYVSARGQRRARNQLLQLPDRAFEIPLRAQARYIVCADKDTGAEVLIEKPELRTCRRAPRKGLSLVIDFLYLLLYRIFAG